MTRRTSRRITTLEKKDGAEKDGAEKDGAETPSNGVEGKSGAEEKNGARNGKDGANSEDLEGDGAEKPTGSDAGKSTASDAAKDASSNGEKKLSEPDAPHSFSSSSSALSSSCSSTSTPSPVKMDSILEKVRMVFGLELAMGNWRVFKTAKHVVLDKDAPSSSQQPQQWAAGEKLMSFETVLEKVEKVFENEIGSGEWSLFTTEKHIILDVSGGGRGGDAEVVKEGSAMKSPTRRPTPTLPPRSEPSDPVENPSKSSPTKATQGSASSPARASSSPSPPPTVDESSTSSSTADALIKGTKRKRGIDEVLEPDADAEASTGDWRKAKPEETVKRIKSKEVEGKEKRKSEVGKERRKGEGKRGNDDDEEWTMGSSRRRPTSPKVPQYNCTLCSSGFSATDSLKVHLVQAHGGVSEVFIEKEVEKAIAAYNVLYNKNEDGGGRGGRSSSRASLNASESALTDQRRQTTASSTRSSTPTAANTTRSSTPTASSSPSTKPVAKPVPTKSICPHCSATFGNAVSLGRHVQIFHSTPVSCEDCGGVFGSEEELKQHAKESHDVEQEEVEEEAKEEEKRDEDEGIEKSKEDSQDEEKSDSFNTRDGGEEPEKNGKSGSAADAAEMSTKTTTKTKTTTSKTYEEVDFDEDEMAEFERLLKGGSESPPLETEEEEKKEKDKERSSKESSSGISSTGSKKSNGVFIKQEVADEEDDDVMIEEVVREPRRSITPPIKMEPVHFGDEQLGQQQQKQPQRILSLAGGVYDEDFRAMETDPATLHMRRINRPLSKSDVKAYFFPFVPVRVKIRRSTYTADAWEAFFQFKSKMVKERAMRHGHLLHQEIPLDNLGYDGINAVDEEEIDPKLFFEDATGKVLGVDGVVKRTGSIPTGAPTAVAGGLQPSSTPQQQQQQRFSNKLGRPRIQAASPASAAAEAVASTSSGSKQNLPKIKLNLQQLQQLLGDKQSGLQKNAQGQLILKMPNKDIGQISEKLKILTHQQKAQLQQQQQPVQSKAGESLGNVNIIYPSAGGAKSSKPVSTNLSNVIFRGEEKRLIGDLAKASKAGNLQVIQVRKKSGDSSATGSEDNEEASGNRK